MAIGITVPIRRGKSGYFEQSYDALKQVKSNLINLLLTHIGERPFQPQFGCEIHNLVFTQMDDQYETSVKNSIIRAVRKWMPFLEILTVEVVRDEDRNRTLVQLTFRLRTTENITETIVIEF